MDIKATPLNAQHRELGAKMVDFGGWDMPVQYASILGEHAAVRERAGLFDVSHMGVFEVRGPAALAALQYLVPNDLERLAAGQGLYTQLCNEAGGVLDDLLIFCLAAGQYWLVVNAANRESDYAWIERQVADFDCRLQSRAEELGILALQGPQAQAILAQLCEAPLDLERFPAFALQEAEVAGLPLHFSRSGYTGEDGFELYVPQTQVVTLWQQLLEAGRPLGLEPAGLGARDTLRLEAAMPLYGHELDAETSPLEAGLGWSVKLQKTMDFMGKAALVAQKAQGLKKKRIGFTLPETRRAPRQGYALYSGTEQIGTVTSGSLSPTLDLPIGMAYVDSAFADLETFEVDVRGRRYPAQRTKLPFYRRKK